MQKQPSSPESAVLADLTGKYCASLSSVQTRLRRLRKTFDQFDSKVTLRLRSTDIPKAGETDRKIHNPLVEFEKPSDVVNDPALSQTEKKEALENLEQDAHQLLTASNEGMAPEKDHIAKNEPKLDEVVRAKDRIGEKPQHKPAQ